MSNWTIKEKTFGLFSAAAPLVAFACAASFYGNLMAMSAEPQSLAKPQAIFSVLGLAYFLTMVIAAIFNLSGLVARFETGEPVPRSQQLIFSGLVAFGGANILLALLN